MSTYSEASDDSVPLPISILFENETFKIFEESEEALICLTNFEPVSVNIEVSEGERKSDLLFNSCFYFTILELKARLEIGEKNDVVIDFPELNLFSIHQDHGLFKELTCGELWAFLSAQCAESGIDCPATLSVKVNKLPNCVKDRVRHLFSLTRKGGLPSNPIVIDDTTGDEQTVDLDNRPDVAGDDDLIDLDDDEGDDEIQTIETAAVPTINPLTAAIAIERIHGAEEDDLFSEDDEEIDELAQEVSVLVDAEMTVGEDLPKDEDFVKVPEDDDYLSSSNTILQPLFQKLDEENKSSSTDPSSTSTNVAVTLESIEESSSKREFVNEADQDDAIGTPSKKIRV